MARCRVVRETSAFGWPGLGLRRLRYGAPWGGGQELRTRHYKVGTLVMDIVDREKRQSVYQGGVEGMVSKQMLQNPAGVAHGRRRTCSRGTRSSPASPRLSRLSTRRTDPLSADPLPVSFPPAFVASCLPPLAPADARVAPARAPVEAALWPKWIAVVAAGVDAADRCWPPTVDPRTGQHTPGRRVCGKPVTSDVATAADFYGSASSNRRMAICSTTSAISQTVSITRPVGRRRREAGAVLPCRRGLERVFARADRPRSGVRLVSGGSQASRSPAQERSSTYL